MGIRGKSGVYGRLKAEMWRETVALLDGKTGREGEGEKRRVEEGLRRVEEWEKHNRILMAKL